MTNLNQGPTAGQRILDLAIDASGVAGMGLITYGANLIYHPAGFITAGAFLLFGAWKLARGNG